jgi:hypothetical protein
MHKPVMFTRSGSIDDVRGVALSADAAPKTDLIVTWIVRFGNQVTQITAAENSNVGELCDRAAVELGIGIKKWQTTIDRKGSRIFVNCRAPEPIAQDASVHFGNQEWAGKVNRRYSDAEIVSEAQTQLGLEGTWTVRNSVVVKDVKTIEAQREEADIVNPPLPRDSEFVFDLAGTQKTVALTAGATARDQTQAAQKAFGMTVVCGPIEETGDRYTVQTFKPSVYPIVFVRGSERTRSWVDSTKTKVIQEEAQRLFGGRPSVEMLEEPGLVYAVKTTAPKSTKKKSKPESNTRQMTGPGIKPVGSPSIGHRRATPRPEISQRSSDGRDIAASGPDRAKGYRGVDVDVILPQKKQTIKGVALSRNVTIREISELIQRQLRVDLLHPDYIELAPVDWFETKELTDQIWRLLM